MQPKKKLVISLDCAPKEVLEAIAKKYPDGWQNSVIKVELSPEKFFFAITADTAENSYLVKVPVKIDTKIEEEIEKDNYGFLAGNDNSEEEEDDSKDSDSGKADEAESTDEK